MARKRTCNGEGKATVPEIKNAGAELGSESTNVSPNKVDLCNESKGATLNVVEKQPLIRYSRSSSKKTAGSRGTPVRKSQRLQSAALDAPMQQELQRITEEIIASDEDDDDDDNDVQQVDDAEVILEGKSLEERIDYLLQVCEEHQEILDSLKSKHMVKGTPGETSGAGEVTYKSLYIDSQKKVEAFVGETHQLMKKIEDLEEENHQLNKRLEHALGKIEVYEKGNVVPSSVLEKCNAVLFCPSSAKDTETACDVLSEAIRGTSKLTGMACAKRKKETKTLAGGA